jgi:uncharacterized protein YdeI (YjbR/CyaY-like superfamily)
MASVDPRVDRYIEKSAEFAQPILRHLRKLIHRGCPEVVETIKWSFPNFESHGAIMCSMAAFNEHCAFGFWKASIMNDPKGILQLTDRHSMGHLDRITSLKDLPTDTILVAYIREATRLNKEKIKLPPKKKPIEPKALTVPPSLKKALEKNKKAKTTFENFSPSQRKEYIQWITEAKTEVTQSTRLKTAIEWMAEGKIRNWKYVR